MLVYAGLRTIPVKLPRTEVSTMVTLSYIREGDTIEWLEGWVNPMVMQQLAIGERYLLVAQAQRKLVEIVRKVVNHGQPHERT